MIKILISTALMCYWNNSKKAVAEWGKSTKAGSLFRGLEWFPCWGLLTGVFSFGKRYRAWVEDGGLYKGQPRNLQDLCRIKIRQCIGLQNLKLLDELPIAKVMKDYLKHKFDDIWYPWRKELWASLVLFQILKRLVALHKVYPMQILIFLWSQKAGIHFLGFFIPQLEGLNFWFLGPSLQGPSFLYNIAF